MSYSPPPAGVALPAWAGARWRWVERLVVAGAGGLLVALLATAAWLTPSSEGMGTHQQLGLPRCTVVEWLGVRCPACGMTTSWAHMMRGHVVAAMQVNAGGALLALAAAACGPWLVGCGFCGRWLVGPPREGLTLIAGLMIAVVTLTQWAVRVGLGW